MLKIFVKMLQLIKKSAYIIYEWPPQQTKMDHPQPLSVIFPQIYPLLKRAAEVWIKDPDVMDTLSSVLKQVI